MALTPLVPEGGAGWLSKEKIGASIYYIKDLPLREMLNDAATKVAATAINDDNKNSDAYVPTNKAILAYLEDAIQGLTGAMHFAGVTDPEAGSDFATRVAALYDGKTPEAGDIVIDGNKEFVFDGTNWKELGDEGIYATEADLQALEIAGVPLGSDHNITAAELKTALGLGSFAYANSGTGSINTVDTASVSIPAATLTLSGSAVSVPQTFSALDVTPAGEVAATASAVDISYDKFKSASVSIPDMTNAQYQDVSSVVITSGSEGTVNYTPAGSVSVAADAAATFNPHTAAVATVTDAGTAYSLAAGSVSQGADTKAAFASEGVVAAMDTTDTEMLVFSDASTAQAVTASGAVSYTDPVLSGALPTFGSANVVDSATITLPSFSGAFTGTGAVLSATANKSNANITGVGTTTAALSNLGFDSITVTVPAQAITASFTGTAKSVTPAAATSADAAPANATAAVAAQTLDVDLVKSNKTVTVNPVQA